MLLQFIVMLLISRVFSFQAANRRPILIQRTISKMSNNLAASIGDVSVVDSHVHTWGDGAPPLVYAGANSAPPSDLQGNCGSPDTLLQLMKDANVRGCVIIQPINYLYDHSYLLKVMKDGPGSGRFKFVCLLNPTFSTVQEGDEYLENLSNHGFCGVRFNPYLWPEGSQMSDHNGLSWFKTAGRLGMPVGIMCFRGLDLHYDDILRLVEQAAGTKVVIDHFGFFLQGGAVNEAAWRQLLSLAKYPQVHIKIAALFRLSQQPWPHVDLDERLIELVDAFSCDRLLFGTDFPYVQQQPGAPDGRGGYASYVVAPRMWPKCQASLTEEQWEKLYAKTAESLYGTFDSSLLS